jgi:HAD superfamily hydrolase (TIGR01509 family)
MQFQVLMGSDFVSWHGRRVSQSWRCPHYPPHEEMGIKTRSVFFDIDGTLLDTTYLHTLAWWRALDEAGSARPMVEIHSLIGMGGSELLTTLLGHDDPEITEAHKSNFEEMHDDIRPLPGAREILHRVDQEGGKVVLVSSANERDAQVLLNTLGCEDVVDDVIHGDMAEASKPAHDLFSIALERCGDSPDDVLALGDAIWDINAAASAGIDCVALESGGTDHSRLKWAGALAVYRGCSELLTRWSSSPLAGLLGGGMRRSSISHKWSTMARVRVK